MAATKTSRNSKRQVARDVEHAMTDQIEQAKELTSDVVEYLTEYARDNPGRAAVACLGVGFLLGWRLKPW